VDAANAFWNHPGGTDYNVKLYEQDNTAFHYSPNDEIVPFGAKHPNGGVTSDPFAHLLKKHSGDKKAAVYDAAKELGMALEDRIDCIEGLDFGDPEKDFEQDTEKKTKGLKPIKWMEIFLANTNEKLIRFRRKDYRFDNGLGWIYWNEENFVAKVRRFMDVFENCKYNTRTDVVNNVIETIRSHYRLENEDIVFPVALTKNETYHAKSLPNSVSFSNGTLNYFTKEFTPMTHDIFDPNVIPYAYKPELAGTESNCIKWFRQMFDSDEAIDFLYWMLADCLLPNQANEVIWELIGEGGTGRGTLVKLISAMIGRSNYLPATLSLFQKGTDFNWANVVGMKVFCFPDIGNSVPTLITEHLKSMSGRDEQSYGAKYGKDLLRTTHSPRIVIVANRYVDFKDPGGMDRRLRIIKFVHQFTGEKEDPRFFEKKILPEIPALMASLIKHVARNFKERIPDGPFTKEELRNQELSASPTLRFIEEELCYALGESIKTSDLYSRFEAWCGENGIKKPPIKDVLCKDIKRFFGKNELWRGVENDRRRKKCILNIDWKSSTTSGVDDSYLTTKVEAKNDDFFTEKTESTVQDTSFATGVLTGVPIGVTGVPTSDFEKMLGSEFPDVTN
jgi:P4 family phage/plasmid primase-like protien